MSEAPDQQPPRLLPDVQIVHGLPEDHRPRLLTQITEVSGGVAMTEDGMYDEIFIGFYGVMGGDQAGQVVGMPVALSLDLADRLLRQLSDTVGLMKSRHAPPKAARAVYGITVSGGGKLHYVAGEMPNYLQLHVPALCGRTLTPLNYFHGIDDYRRSYNVNGEACAGCERELSREE